MAQGNLTWQRGDITGDIYFDYLRPQNQDPIPYVRLYLMIDGSPESKPVKGLRVLVYGTLAELQPRNLARLIEQSFTFYSPTDQNWRRLFAEVKRDRIRLLADALGLVLDIEEETGWMSN